MSLEGAFTLVNEKPVAMMNKNGCAGTKAAFHRCCNAALFEKKSTLPR